MRSLLLLLFCSAGIITQAAEAPYAVGSIPAPLLKNADVIVRSEEMTFEVTADNEAILHTRKVYTILNENGDKRAALAVFYDKMHRINTIEGSLYDSTGKLLRKLKSKELQDFSAVDNISLMDDNRVKVYNFNQKMYPYTIEYETEVKLNNTYEFPDWTPMEDEHIAVEKSSYTLITPADYPVRYKAFNYKGEPVVSMDKNRKIRTWKVENLPAAKSPFAAPTWKEQTTSILFAPSTFQMEGYKGNASTWEEFGKFSLQLNQGRDKLPDNVLQTVKQLTAGLTDEREKIKALYEYLQKNTRYISIQLGIGGLQPFEASFVAQQGYGDCKALSNYMYSLLKAAGIPSYYTLVSAGRSIDDQFVLEDFPAEYFNHIIVCVPLRSDTMWLECTDQTLPAGYMGGFTGNRKALLITEGGGKLVSTPRYGIKENLQVRRINGTLNETGDLQASVQTRYSAMQQDEIHMMISQLSKDKVKELLNGMLGLSTYTINNFHYNEERSALPTIEETLDLTVNRFATISGKRLFLTPNLLNRSANKLTAEEERKVDICFTYAYRDADTVVIQVPAGYEVESIMPEVNLKTKFGTYSASMKFADNKITYIRTREQYSGRYPPRDYAALEEYYNAIYKADRNRVVLVKK